LAYAEENSVQRRPSFLPVFIVFEATHFISSHFSLFIFSEVSEVILTHFSV